MKETKFLSIAIGLLQGQNAQNGISDKAVDEMDADRLYKLVRAAVDNYGTDIAKRVNPVDRPGSNQRNRFHGNGIADPHGDLGNVYIETVCGDKGTPAQVKFFKLLEGESLENFDRVNGQITMIRDMTGFDGCLSRRLSVGDYVVEISKGSEYGIITDAIQIRKDTTLTKRYDLNHFVDLAREGWIAGDLHHHCIYSSPVFRGDDDVVESPSEVANSMMAMGLSYGALSDHHNTLNHDLWRALKSSEFTPVVSKEISTSNGHVMALGVEKDVIYKIPEDKDRTDEYLRGEFVRVTDEIRKEGGLPQINHPRDLQVSISWNPKFEDLLHIFETMEIWNGSNPMMAGSTNDRARDLWIRCLKKGEFFPATTGSDTHNIAADDYHILLDEMLDTRDIIASHKDELSREYADEVYVFLKICEDLLPILEKWAETNLTSGGVRTYIKVNGEPDQSKVLDALRNGHSFLTDGPIIIPKVNGRLPGKTDTQHSDNDLDIDLKILSNRELKTLRIYGENGLIRELFLQADKKNGFYDYSMKVTETAGGNKYIYFEVADDCTNMAITNPVIVG